MIEENKYIVCVYLKDDYKEEPIKYTVNTLEEIKELPFYNQNYRCFTILETNPSKTKSEIIREKLIEKLFNASSICKSYRQIYNYKKVTTKDMIYMFGEEHVNQYSYIKKTIRQYLKAINHIYEIGNNEKTETILLKYKYAYHFNEIFRLYEEAQRKNIFNNEKIFNYIFMNYPMGAYSPDKNAFKFVSYAQETIEEFDPSIKVYTEEFEKFKEERHNELLNNKTLKKSL